MVPFLARRIPTARCAGDAARGRRENCAGIILSSRWTNRWLTDVAGDRGDRNQLIHPGRAGGGRRDAIYGKRRGRGLVELVIHDRLLLGSVNLLEVADAGFGAGRFAGADKVWDGNRKQNSDDQHDNHDLD